MEINETHIHDHLRERMEQRGVTLEEINGTLKKGWEAEDARPGTGGKTYVFEFGEEWLGETYEEKEVTVYYRYDEGEELVILTVKARYGHGFSGSESS